MAKETKTPTKYAVLVSFTDREDENTAYWAGKDTYPRAGYEPSEERVAYLQSGGNAFKKPVIAKK